MIWKVILFESKRGERPIEKFIKNLNPSTTAKIAHTIDLLEKHGAFLGMPHTKKLTKEIHELRIRGKEEIRILYALMRFKQP